MLIHDFYPVSPSYTLMGRAGYAGVPVAGGPLGDDPAHRFRHLDGRVTGLAAWQAAWGRLVAQADRITTFSASSRDIIAQVWPEAAPRITVTPHAMHSAVARITRPAPAPGDGPPVIGVLGNISPAKGAPLLQALSRHWAGDGAARLVLIGQLDPAWRLAAPSVVHGAYRLDDLPTLVARYGIRAWLIPSLWPETFSFATHEALATGLPVVAFDLGAQGQAVAQAVAQGAPGAVLPLALAQGGDLAGLGAHLVAVAQQ